MFFDPLHLTFTQKNFTSDDYLGKARTTGERPILPGIEGSDKDIGDLPSRIVTAVLDRGTMCWTVSKLMSSPKLQELMRDLIDFMSSL